MVTHGEGGIRQKMNSTAREVYHVLERWLEEHPFKRLAGSINEAKQDFIHVMPSVIGDGQFSGHNTDTIIKGACLVSPCSFYFLMKLTAPSCTVFTCTIFSVALVVLNCKAWISFIYHIEDVGGQITRWAHNGQGAHLAL